MKDEDLKNSEAGVGEAQGQSVRGMASLFAARSAAEMRATIPPSALAAIAGLYIAPPAEVAAALTKMVEGVLSLVPASGLGAVLAAACPVIPPAEMLHALAGEIVRRECFNPGANAGVIFRIKAEADALTDERPTLDAPDLEM